MYPKLKALRDSLDARYGPAPTSPPTKPRADSVFIESYQVQGLPPATEELLLLLLRPRHYYTAPLLSAAIRDAFGTRAFRKITYSLQPASDSSARLVFDVEPAAATRVGLGLNYNSLTSIGLIGSLTVQDKLAPASTSQIAFNIGENPRLHLKHVQYLGPQQRLVGRLLAQGERVSITTYSTSFRKAGLYTQNYVLANAQLLRLLDRNRAVGLGTRYEYGRFTPEITSRLQLDGRISLLNSDLFYEENTLNAVAYPTHGRKVEVEYGWVYQQRPSFKLLSDTTIIGTEQSTAFSFQPYEHSRLNVEQYLLLNKRATLQVQVQAGVNRRYRQAIANDFVVGGLNGVLRNQLTFAGLPETGIYTGSAVAGLVGYQYAVSPKVFLTAKANALYYDFIANEARPQSARLAYGGALSLGLNSFLGPIDVSLMYSNVAKKLLPYFNVGFPFGYR